MALKGWPNSFWKNLQCDCSWLNVTGFTHEPLHACTHTTRTHSLSLLYFKEKHEILPWNWFANLERAKPFQVYLSFQISGFCCYADEDTWPVVCRQLSPHNQIHEPHCGNAMQKPPLIIVKSTKRNCRQSPVCLNPPSRQWSLQVDAGEDWDKQLWQEQRSHGFHI